MSEEISVDILVDAKNEYTKHLTTALTPTIHLKLSEMFNEAKLIAFREGAQAQRSLFGGEQGSGLEGSKNPLMEFQLLLKGVPQWNQDMVDKEYQRIISESGCEWLDKLIEAVFVSNAKILSAVRLNKRQKNIKLNIPSSKNFIHKCYILCATAFYHDPFKFDDDIDSALKQRNYKDSRETIKELIEESVRALLPVQHILKVYLDDMYDEDPEDKDITLPGNDSNLEKMANKEVDSYQNGDTDPDEMSNDEFESDDENDASTKNYGQDGNPIQDDEDEDEENEEKENVSFFDDVDNDDPEDPESDEEPPGIIPTPAPAYPPVAAPVAAPVALPSYAATPAPALAPVVPAPTPAPTYPPTEQVLTQGHTPAPVETVAPYVPAVTEQIV